MPPRAKEPVIVGWREFVSLPEWGIKRLKAKVDTGARTSSIHVSDLEELPGGKVRFKVVIREKPKLRTKYVVATPVRRSTVKPSSGIKQERLVFKTALRIGPFERQVELSLVSRKGMLCRMLVGRTALPSHFLVSPTRKYLHSDAPGTRKAAKKG
jgi:hypothetical protein